MARIFIVMFIQLAACISISHAALTCYSCTNCGITWNDSKATIVQTSGSGDYCRKAVAGVVINRDFSSSCSSANVLGHGIFCCETDLYDNPAPKDGNLKIKPSKASCSNWGPIRHFKLFNHDKI
ncbi:unnamed protein product [Rotaria magnacalcarata]|uniref:Uncharacterized protein n=2 Tax=Rotaria magnacalcarata TaxID=392030 RepID=A0A814ZRY2_9BILA|nr:unnamed protein product [Rotaria magnacalcarata]CAF4096903.1 unnamed protein product [Rotaria magnacalcarata]